MEQTTQETYATLPEPFLGTSNLCAILFGYLDSLLSVTLMGLVFSTLLLMMSMFRPQKSKFHCNVDCVFLFFLAVLCLIVVGGDFTHYHKTTCVITECALVC